ncbi:MAG: fasciclin domain-containing protein [Bacteroidota bacterium]
MKNIQQVVKIAAVWLLMMTVLAGCKKQYLTLTTTEDVNIVDYLRKYPDQFSEYIKILDRTNISPFLNAYGTYTAFAPTNDAIKAYLVEIGKTSTDQLDTTTLKNLCRLHIIQDTISTPSFIDGKLYAPTMYGQFLVTGVSDEGVIIINRRAKVTKPNVLTGNGYVHVIDKVLVPATLTVAQLVEKNTRYSIFTQALKATGLYDSLNITNNPDTTLKWRTLIAESDSALNAGGIASYAALKAKYNNTGNPKNLNDSLYLYMSYHILPGIKYIADIVGQQSHKTMAPLEVVTVTIDGQKVLLNEAVFNDILEKGVPINRGLSDNSCSNGVLHEITGNIVLKIRSPYLVNFDFAVQPEILKLTSIYRKAGKSQAFNYGQLADVTWQNTTLQAVNYYCEGPTGTNNYWWDDGFGLNLRYGNSAANNWVEFKTPLLVKGKYEVWFMYRRANMGAYTQVSFDGVPTGVIVDFTQSLPSTSATDAALIAQGFKRYSFNNPNGNNIAQKAGTVTVTTTDRHILRLQAVRDNGSGVTQSVTLDFVQFVPLGTDPTRPVFARNGTIVP